MKCTNLHFDGLTDETINQGADFDALEGVKAYDADGNEIDFSVEPEEFDSCAVGEQTLVYKAMGKDNRLIPSMCIPKDSSGANLPLGCTLTLLKENRKITVLQADPPRFTMNDVTIPKNTTLDVLDGVSAVDDNGNPITDIDYSGYLDKQASGDIVSISDGDNKYPVKSLKVSLAPIQSGSGDPSPDNVRPISGHTECVTEVCGVNLMGGIDLANSIADYCTANINTEEKTVSYAYNATIMGDTMVDIPWKERTRYTFIITALNPSIARTNFRINYSDSSYDVLNISAVNTKEMIVFTSDENKTIANVAKAGQGGTTVLYYDECGVFEGVLTADQFEPYQGTSYTTTLGRTVYGGTLDVVSGELVVDKIAVEYDGTETNWTASGSYVGSFYARDSRIPSQDALVSCSHLTATKYVANYQYGSCLVDGGSYAQNINLYLFNEQTPKETFINYLKAQKANGTPITVVYELATPQTYQLDPQTISLVHGNNNVWSDGEVTMVYSVELPTDGEVSYPLEGEYEITYSATDKCGNVGEAIRHITVQ